MLIIFIFSWKFNRSLWVYPFENDRWSTGGNTSDDIRGIPWNLGTSDVGRSLQTLEAVDAVLRFAFERDSRRSRNIRNFAQFATNWRYYFNEVLARIVGETKDGCPLEIAGFQRYSTTTVFVRIFISAASTFVQYKLPKFERPKNRNRTYPCVLKIILFAYDMMKI